MLKHFSLQHTFKRGRLTEARGYICRVSDAPFTEQELLAWGGKHGHLVTRGHMANAPEIQYYAVVVQSAAERRRREAK